ncbi:hypothetical protein HAX54_040736, partial [Datura stramonium]|nr:hypothetical protein [Datura stramonium]
GVRMPFIEEIVKDGSIAPKEKGKHRQCLPCTRSRVEPLIPYHAEHEITLRRAMNAHKCEAGRLQQLANAQIVIINAHNNEDDDI